jgi:5-methylcytosine-specific restriction endonuclease McrA
MYKKHFYIAAKSKDSWFQLPVDVRISYKIKLSELYGSRCYNNGSSRNNWRTGSGCGKYLPLNMLTVDHIVPISKGGPVSDINNMQLLCLKCHQKKTTDLDIIQLQ